VAAFDKYAAALIIVDFGTAITFDCVSRKGEYLGGIITPGLSISLDALGRKTAKLPRVDITVAPAKAIGKNTIEAIRSGVLFGYGGLVEELISRIREEMTPEKPKVIATGGMAALIAPHAPSIEAVEPMLTLEGLRLLHARNS
ncbi:MAG: type III pantothenate kinase, partial [Desulfurivibrionaceae bacterium]